MATKLWWRRSCGGGGRDFRDKVVVVVAGAGSLNPKS